MNKRIIEIEFDMDDLIEASVYAYLIYMGCRKDAAVINALMATGEINPRIAPIQEAINKVDVLNIKGGDDA